jgi:hypothetical protein
MDGSNAPCQLSLPVCTWNEESEWKEQESKIYPGKKGYLAILEGRGTFLRKRLTKGRA